MKSQNHSTPILILSAIRTQLHWIAASRCFCRCRSFYSSVHIVAETAQYAQDNKRADDCHQRDKPTRFVKWRRRSCHKYRYITEATDGKYYFDELTIKISVNKTKSSLFDTIATACCGSPTSTINCGCFASHIQTPAGTLLISGETNECFNRADCRRVWRHGLRVRSIRIWICCAVSINCWIQVNMQTFEVF